MKNRNIKLLLLFLIVVLPLVVRAAQLNSSNYQIYSYVISGGGGNITSSNYKTDFTVGSIADNITSTSYKNYLGFWYTVSVGDKTPPTYSNFQNNASATETKINGVVNWSINLSDETELNGYKFAHNNSGILTNGSFTFLNGTSAFINKTITITKIRNNYICGQFWFNDSSNNINQTLLTDSNACFTVANTVPTTVDLSYPGNNTAITNTTPRFNWTDAIDADNDPIYYDIFINCLGGCSVDDRNVYNLTDANYTISPPLKYYQDDGYKYEWWVRASDNISYGENSSKFNFTVSSSVVVSLPTASVSFGTLSANQQNDTTDDNPSPIEIQNDGTCYINVNITADSYLWDSQQQESSYFQYKIDNVSTEKESFNWSASATSWRNFSLTNSTGIYKLNYSDATDSAEIDINITVPPNEPAGSKQSNVLFTGYYVMVT